jgi:hypothetical protein
MNKDNYQFKVCAEVNADMADYLDLPNELSHLKDLCTPAQLASTFLTHAYLEKKGDISKRLRRIRHFAYCASKKAAKRLAKKALQEGYIEVFVMPVKNKRWRVDFCGIGNGQFESIVHYVCRVRNFVVDSGCEYDGWESPVMHKDAPDEVLMGKDRELVESIFAYAPQSPVA